MSRPTHYSTRDRLTDRQQEILALVERGHTNGEIAQELGITLDGVKWHLREAFTKLDVTSREDAVAAWKSSQREGRLGGWLALGWLRWTVAGAGVLAIAAVVGVIAVAMTNSAGSDAAGREPVIRTVVALLRFDEGNLTTDTWFADYPGGTRTPVPVLSGDRGVAYLEWSPDGQRLLANVEQGSMVTSEHWAMIAPDGSLLGSVPDEVSDGMSMRPAWAPDSAAVAIGTRDELVLLTADGKRIDGVSWPDATEPGTMGFARAWSEDGSTLAVVRTDTLLLLGRDGESRAVELPEEAMSSGNYPPDWLDPSTLRIYTVLADEVRAVDIDLDDGTVSAESALSGAERDQLERDRLILAGVQPPELNDEEQAAIDAVAPSDTPPRGSANFGADGVMTVFDGEPEEDPRSRPVARVLYWRGITALIEEEGWAMSVAAVGIDGE